MTPADLRKMAEDTKDDELERLAEKFRRHHLEEIKKAESARFGRVYPIGRDDYTREVTEASKVTIPGDSGKGTGVVCLLYKDGSVRFSRYFLDLTSCQVAAQRANVRTRQDTGSAPSKDEVCLHSRRKMHTGSSRVKTTYVNHLSRW